jgi:hypothetical protein
MYWIADKELSKINYSTRPDKKQQEILQNRNNVLPDVLQNRNNVRISLQWNRRLLHFRIAFFARIWYNLHAVLLFIARNKEGDL